MTGEQMRDMSQNAKRLGFRPERLMLLDERLTQWSKTKETPSIVARVLRHGQPAFEGAYGALGPDKAPDSLTADAIFPVCSMTKAVMTALLCVMQEEGLIDLNYPVRDYIPELTCDPKGKIRFWHLLTHTSGLIEADMDKHFYDYIKRNVNLPIPDRDMPQQAWDEIYLKIREQLGLPYMEPCDAVRRQTYNAVRMSAPPTHGVHKVMSYCSLGFDLIKETIVKISGKPIDQVAGEKLFGPLGMRDSHFIFPRGKMPRYVTRGEEYCGSHWLNESVLDSESGGGGLKSTAADMTRFGQMFLNQGKLDGVRVLSPATVNEITRDHNPDMPDAEFDGEMYGSNWGLGFGVLCGKKDDLGSLRSARSFDHGGFGCVMLMCDPDYDLVTAFFSVALEDNWPHMALFHNMVHGAIDE